MWPGIDSRIRRHMWITNQQAFRPFVFVMEIRIAYRSDLIGWFSYTIIVPQYAMPVGWQWTVKFIGSLLCSEKFFWFQLICSLPKALVLGKITLRLKWSYYYCHLFRLLQSKIVAWFLFWFINWLIYISFQFIGQLQVRRRRGEESIDTCTSSV